jgi:hypothetical protein
MMNTHVRDNLLYLYGGGAGGADAVRVHSLSDHTLAANTWDNLAYNEASFDVNSNMAGSSGSTGLTFPVAGKYVVGMHAQFSAAAAGRRGCRLVNVDNGVVRAKDIRDEAVGGSESSTISFSTLLDVVSIPKVIRGQAYQESGSALTIVSTADHDSYAFWACRVA